MAKNKYTIEQDFKIVIKGKDREKVEFWFWKILEESYQKNDTLLDSTDTFLIFQGR